MDLFEAVHKNSDTLPLAERMRPHRVEDFIGQETLLKKDSHLKKILLSEKPLSSYDLMGATRHG